MTRKIAADLYVEFENRLTNVNQAQNCIAVGDARGLLVEAAHAFVDLHEVTDNRGKWIDVMNNDIGNPMGASWCMAFVQSCIAYVEKRTHVISPLEADGTCMTVWDNSPISQRVKSLPLGGAVAIWQNVADKNHGHTGIVIDCDGTSMHTFEGNTSASKKLHDGVESDGDGVFRSERRWDLFNVDDRGKLLLGALKPF